MDVARLLRHLAMTSSRVRHTFPPTGLRTIAQAVSDSEARHSGQVRFVIEGSLDGAPLLQGQGARERAIDLFSRLRIWDTEHNNGVLIYVLLADRRVEILADRGIHARAGSQPWDVICRGMEARFAAGDFVNGAVAGIQAVTDLLARHDPPRLGAHNELADAPVVL